MQKNFLQDIANEHEDQLEGDFKEQKPYDKNLFMILRREGLAE
jgi:hypothetical protein